MSTHLDKAFKHNNFVIAGTTATIAIIANLDDIRTADWCLMAINVLVLFIAMLQRWHMINIEERILSEKRKQSNH